MVQHIRSNMLHNRTRHTHTFAVAKTVELTHACRAHALMHLQQLPHNFSACLLAAAADLHAEHKDHCLTPQLLQFCAALCTLTGRGCSNRELATNLHQYYTAFRIMVLEAVTHFL